MGVPGISFQLGVHRLISVDFGVLDRKRFEKPWPKEPTAGEKMEVARDREGGWESCWMHQLPSICHVR